MKKMKKYTALALAALLLFASLTLFWGCGRVTYDEEQTYKAGGTVESEEPIRAIEIFWQSGEVKITGVLTDNVIVMDGRLPGDPLTAHHRVKDGVLQIYPCASGENASRLEKTLTVKIPYETANALSGITVTTVSADVSCSLVGVENLTVVTDSGDIDYMGDAKKVSVVTDTGDLSMKVSTVDEIRFVSDSGDADVAVQTTGFFAVLNQTNGEIAFEGPITVYQNGNIYSYGDMKTQMVFTTDSGEVELSLWNS